MEGGCDGPATTIIGADSVLSAFSRSLALLTRQPVIASVETYVRYQRLLTIEPFFSSGEGAA